MQRRTFLALGVSGAALVAVAGWFASSRRHSPMPEREARTIIGAVAPAMLAGALPQGAERAGAIDDVVAGVMRAIAGLPPAAQNELGGLFALLDLDVARRAFAGVAPPWGEASEAEISAFLDRWQQSGWALKRSAYDALHQLVLAAWYGSERSWPAIGYPGPPAIDTR